MTAEEIRKAQTTQMRGKLLGRILESQESLELSLPKIWDKLFVNGKFVSNVHLHDLAEKLEAVAKLK